MSDDHGNMYIMPGVRLGVNMVNVSKNELISTWSTEEESVRQIEF